MVAAAGVKEARLEAAEAVEKMEGMEVAEARLAAEVLEEVMVAN